MAVSTAVTSEIPLGSSGRYWRSPSRATSSRIFRSAINRSIAPIRAMMFRCETEMMTGLNLAAARDQFQDIFVKVQQLGPEFDDLRFLYNVDFKAICAGPLSMALLTTGYPDEALRISEIGRRRAQGIRHSMSLCTVLLYEMAVLEARGDLVTLEQRANECVEVGQRDNLAGWPLWASAYLALIQATKADVEGGLALMDGVLNWLDGVQYRFSRPLLLR